MRITTLIFSLFFSLSLLAQPNNRKAFKKIYGAAISYCFKKKTKEILINDTTVNEYISQRNYANLASNVKENNIAYIGNVNLDSSWAPFLQEADVMKVNLKSYRIPVIKIPGFAIHLLKRESTETGPNGANLTTPKKHVKLSNIIYSKRRAIVEISHVCGPLCGEGLIYFLEKKKGKWEVVSFLSTWIS